jgi:protein gp37
MANSKIEWTESTWNPVTGCTKISAGCANCYAERMAKRLHAMGQANYTKGFEVALHPHVVEYPLKWKKKQMIFVNSMSDLFHESVPLKYIRQIFDVMTRARWHTFQILTKRSERLAELAPLLSWPENVWMGVTAENIDCVHRIDDLREVPSAVRFISMEPLLSSMEGMNLENMDWVIVGGESGPGSRPIEMEWVRNIRKQCCEANVPFFFKQWGGVNKKRSGRLLDGHIYDEMPKKKNCCVF